MRSLRTTEIVMLGYPIERVDTYDSLGLLQETHYEVLSAHSGSVIGSHATLRAAQNFVLSRELEAVTEQSLAA